MNRNQNTTGGLPLDLQLLLKKQSRNIPKQKQGLKTQKQKLKLLRAEPVVKHLPLTNC